MPDEKELDSTFELIERVRQGDRELLQTLSQLRARPEASKLQRSLVEAELYKRLLTWRTLLDEHTPHARQLLKKLLRAPMRLVPEDGVYRWSAEIVLGKFFLGIFDPTMVASPTGASTGEVVGIARIAA
jgi:hypothetical protein